jgi:PAS domain S-box-containing protein
VLVVAAWFVASSLRRENRRSRHRMQLELVSRKLEQSIAWRLHIVRSLAENAFVRAVITNEDAPDNPRIDLVLNTARDAAGASLVYILDRSGIVRSSTAYEEGRLTGNDYGFRPYFTRAINGEDFVYLARGVTTHRRGMYLSSPITLPGESKPAGVAVVKIRMREMDRMLSEGAGIRCLVSPDGVIFCSGRKDWIFHTLDSFTEREQRIVRRSRQFADVHLRPLSLRFQKNTALYRGKPFHVIREPVSIPGWKIVSFQETGEPAALTPFQRILFVSIFAAVLGLFGGIIVLVINIRRRRDTERALRKSEQRYRTLFEGVPLGVYRTTPSGSFLEANMTMVLMFGYPDRRSFMKVNAEDLYVRPEVRDRWLSMMKSEGEVRNFEIEVKRSDGSRFWVRNHSRAFRDRSNRVVHFEGILEDITEFRRHERELQQHREHLEDLVEERTMDLKMTNERLQNGIVQQKQAEKEILELNRELERRLFELRAVNRQLESFSFSVSHDLRAPLRAIQGFSRVLLEDHASRLDAEGKRLLDVITRNTERMRRLIDDLLTFSRLGRQEKNPVEIDMEKIVEDVIREIRSETPEKRIRARVDSLPRAWGDRAMIRQVLFNLVSNAVKFSKKNEPVDIELSGSADAFENTYIVRDSGIGFDSRFAEKLFRVFQRLHGPEEYEGTGVGLAVVQQIVNRHGGRTWAEGRADRGAVFYFTLPRKGAEDE